MKNLFKALLAKYRCPVAPAIGPCTLVITDLHDSIPMHEGDLILVERSFVGFAVDGSGLRNYNLREWPIAHCETLKEAERLHALLFAAIARGDKVFDARKRPKFYTNRLSFQEAIDG